MYQNRIIMGFSSNGLSSLKYNHGMLSKRGAAFKKHRRYVNVDTDPIRVDEDRMIRIETKAMQSEILKLVGMIAAGGLVCMLIMIFLR